MPRPTGITFGGLGDEAGASLAAQIHAHHRLDWTEIELRTIDGIALADLDTVAFSAVCRQLADAQLQVVAISSRIGNWARPITGLFDLDTDELQRLAERAQTLGARYIRIMSYPNDGLSEDQWRGRALERLHILTEIAAQYGVVLIHENCAGWASQSAAHTRDMVQTIDSPALRLLFDIGNPVAYGYDGLAFLQQVLPWVVHVHVKDGIRAANGDTVFTYPGDGAAQVVACLQQLLGHGYQGSWVIEPHLHLIPHLQQQGSPEALWSSFIEYGQHFAALVETHLLAEGLSRS